MSNQNAVGRSADPQQPRNGVINRENGTGRDDDGGRSAFGSGAH
jgi:hypothetical protein